MGPSTETCAICLGSLKSGDGRALFTAECSHIFHFNCIASSVEHGNHICPICRSTWTNLPSQFVPQPNINPFPFTLPHQRPIPIPPPPSSHDNSPLEFADDEPLPTPAPAPPRAPEDESTSPSVLAPPQIEGMTLKALPEYPALSQSEQSDSFAVLVGIRAPHLSPESTDRPETRAPIDLVAVLDVSGSMNGDKIRLLKQAVNFVVDNLGPADRFSIITFSTFATRVTPLKRMTENGRADMALAVTSLRANGCTNIIAGLRKAVQVLEQRREKNPVASIILLSDGQDNQNPPREEGFYTALSQLPASIRTRNMDNSHHETMNDVVPVPVHTFGFGSDHDARALHAVADGSGGTFSYIESIEVIQDAFAQCLGGLLSVVAKDVKIQVQSSSADIGILSISSGRYRNTIHSNAGQQEGVIHLGDLYAEEEKRFLVYLSVPQEMSSSTTRLMEVKCSHKDPLSNDDIETETKIVEIRRPPSEDLSEAERQVCLEVDRERNRVSVAEAIAQAQVMAERGELDGARSLLEQRRVNLRSTASAVTGDALCDWLDSEVRGVQEYMASRAQYESVGRAYALSKRSSHMYQRASTQALKKPQKLSASTFFFSCSVTSARSNLIKEDSVDGASEEVGYETSFMRKMVKKSQLLRKSTEEHAEAPASSKPK